MSLRTRLTLALLVPVFAFGAVLLVGAERGARLYFEEVHHKLNRDVAAHVAKSLRPFADPSRVGVGGAAVDTEALQALFMDVMRINPSLEVYLLDAEGAVLAYDAPPGHVRRGEVALGPILHVLEGPAEGGPPRGDDPRSAHGTKPFSVAELREDGQLRGYLYVILGGERHEAVAASWRESAILRYGAAFVLAGVAIAALGGALGIARIVRPLRRLRDAMASFQVGEQPVLPVCGRRDEVGDLTATYRSMAQRLAQQMDELRDNDLRRRDFVANVSHDLRTPTSVIQGYLETLTMRWSRLEPPERERCLASALRQAVHLGKLVDQLFELTRLEAREFAPRKEAFSLAELVQDVAQKFQVIAERRGAHLRASIATDVPPVVADIGLLERALDNLIDNALRHTPAGGDVEVRLSQVPGGLAVRVSDSGPGIPGDALPHVFERFFRVERSVEEATSGTGLGLAITKRIVDLHDGTIEVDSGAGQGTTFSFVLATEAEGSVVRTDASGRERRGGDLAVNRSRAARSERRDPAAGFRLP